MVQYFEKIKVKFRMCWHIFDLFLLLILINQLMIAYSFSVTDP